MSDTDRRDSILVIDDEPANLRLLTDMLQAQGYKVHGARSPELGLNTARGVLPDIVLLDIMMPEMDGFEVCQKLKADETTREIPIIFISARGETEDIVQGLAVGGVDYIVKPFQQAEVLMRVRTHVERYHLARDLARHAAQLQQNYDELAREVERRKALAAKLEQVSEREAQRWGVEGFVSQSPLLREILKKIKMLEHADSVSVLVTGESGTGKELIARAVHANSARAAGPFLPVNCGTVPREMAESLLFGHGKGAFTGADKDQQGYFDLADGGTLFLDEVGDMPYDLQVKLLRVLEDGQVRSLGAQESHPVDVRVVAATNVDLADKIQEGSLRQDLYYRLARFTVEVPPLRERKEDIPLLAQHFLQLFAREMGLEPPALGKEVVSLLASYDYPGNVRELKNIVEHALIESQGGDIGSEHLHLMAAVDPSASPLERALEELPYDFHEAELLLLERALKKTDGNITAAARLLNVNRIKIYRRLKEAGRLEAFRQ